jgi:hypothetical protein
MNPPIEVGRNPAGTSVTFRMFGEMFYLDPVAARFFAASVVRMAEKVEQSQLTPIPHPTKASR